MKSLIIDKGDTTPLVNFNVETMEFLIQGECRPENVITFFEPIMTWFNDFKSWVSDQDKKKLDFHFKLEYYNSSSSKFIFNIFKQLKAIQENGTQVTMFWFYDVLDEDLLECGEEYEKILQLKFEYIPIQE